MAISDDTAALAAAQLTVAWATLIGPIEAPNRGARVAKAYAQFIEDVRKHASAPPQD